VILVDTSGLLALHEIRSPYRDRALSVIAAARIRLLSPFVLAELDYLITRDAGAHHARILLSDIERGVYTLEQFTRDDISRARAIMEQYGALNIGLADASIVVLAERHGCTDVLTSDQRHFRTVVPSSGNPFRLLLLDDS
jgi:predicted nucleic acid-binding protein